MKGITLRITLPRMGSGRLGYMGICNGLCNAWANIRERSHSANTNVPNYRLTALRALLRKPYTTPEHKA